METGVIKRVLMVWLPLMVTETIHGILRNIFLVPITGDFRARQIGVFIGSALIFTITLLAIRWIGARSAKALLFIGAIWAVLTFAFEVLLGRVLGSSWRRIFEDYDLTHGGLMPLGLALLFVAPLCASRIRRVPLSA